MQLSRSSTPRKQSVGNVSKMLSYTRFKSLASSRTTISHDEDEESDDEDEFIGGASNWTNVVFTPFNPIWQALITFTCVIKILYIASHSVSVSEEGSLFSTSGIYIGLLCESIYLIDFVLCVLHYNWTSVQITREFEPRNVIHLIIDGISLIPLPYILGTKLPPTSREARVARLFAAWLPSIRVYRILDYFRTLHDGSVGSDRVVMIAIEYFTNLILIICVMANIWIYIKLVSGKASWFSTAEGLHLHVNDTSNWNIISVLYMLEALGSNGRSDVYPVNNIEQIITAIASILGIVIFTGILSGEMIFAYIHRYRQFSEFQLKIVIIEKQLRQWNIVQEVYQDIMDYYLMLWEKRSGVVSAPFLGRLPLSFQKEIALDMYWDVFRHSHLFKFLDTSILRSIALYMVPVFFLPGDIVYHQDELRTKLVYIVSGVLQVFSEDDDETPLVSFSGGTCLGEFSLFLSTPSKTVVKCAVYCEVRIMYRNSFAQMMSADKKNAKKFQEHYQHRLENARKMMSIAEGDLKEKLKIKKRIRQAKLRESSAGKEESESESESEEEEWDAYDRGDTPQMKAINWMEDALSDLSVKTHGIHEVTETEPVPQLDEVVLEKDPRLFTSLYLDLYVLSEEVKLRTDKVWLKTTWPWIFQPNSPYLQAWNSIITLICTVSCILYPYYICTQTEFPAWLQRTESLFTLTFIVHLYIEISTAVKVREDIITTIKDIALYRIKEFEFITISLSIIPFNMFLFFVSKNQSFQYASLLSINKFLRITKIVEYFQVKESKLDERIQYIRMWKYILLITYLTYIFGVILYMEACLYEKCNPDSWYGVISTHLKERLHSAFVVSVYYASTLVFGTGIRNIRPITLRDIELAGVCNTVGVVLLVFCTTEFTATHILRGSNKAKYQAQMEKMNAFVDKLIGNPLLKRKLNNFLESQWQYNKAYSFLRGESLFKDATSDLQKDLRTDYIIPQLKLVPLFQDLDEALLGRIASVADTLIVAPNRIISYNGKIIRDMYIIKSGYCWMEIMYKNNIREERYLGPGTHFNVLEMIFELPGFTSVWTKTHCEMLRISYSHLTSCSSTFLHELEEVVHYFKDPTVFRGTLSKEVKMVLHDKKFKRKSFASFWATQEQMYKKPFEKYGAKSSWLRFLLLKWTILPSGIFIICWEVLRIIIATVSTIYYLSFYHVEGTLEPTFYVWFLIFDTLAFVDMYLRLHVGYYNEKNILVTHPLFTAKYYLTHSFVVDFIASFPFEIFRPILSSYMSASTVSTIKGYVSVIRLLQMYRLIGFYNIMSKNIKKAGYILFVRLLYLFFLTLMFCYGIGSILLVETCNFWVGEEGIYCECKNNTWFTVSAYKDTVDALRCRIVATYFVIGLMVRNLKGNFFANSSEEMVWIILLSICGYIYQMILVANVVSCISRGASPLQVYQEKMKRLVGFMNSEKVQLSLSREIIMYFESMWMSKRGSVVADIVSVMPRIMQEELTFYLYESSIRKVPFFADASEPFMRLVASQCKEKFYVKDCIIAKCNDIQCSLYVVDQGQVDVIAADGKYMCTLTHGSLIGNIHAESTSRRGVTLKARSHCILLEMPDKVYTQVFKYDPHVRLLFKSHSPLSCDYIQSEESSYITETELDVVSSSDFELQLTHFQYAVERIRKVYYWVCNHQSRAFKVWSFISDLFLAYISTVIFMAHPAFRTSEFEYYSVAYIIDSMYLLKIYVSLRTSYEDESGEVITDIRKIRHRYIKDPTGFAVDLLSVLPFEGLAPLFPRKLMMSLAAMLMSNRLIRVVYMYKYFKNNMGKLNVNILFLKCCSACVWISLLIEFCALLWFVPKTRNYPYECDEVYLDTHYFKHNTDIYKPNLYRAEQNSECFFLSVINIVNILSSSIYSDLLPFETWELIYTIVMFIVFRLALVVLIAIITSILEAAMDTKARYESHISMLLKYLKDRDLSPALVKNVWKYLQLLWMRQKGEFYPQLMSEAPDNLQMELKYRIYGKLLQKNPTFKDLHIDLIRQLCLKLERTVYFPGNCIVKEGDLDSRCYFIHHGEVEVMERLADTEIVKEVLGEDEAFGIVQAYFADRRHDNTIRAKTFVDILILKQSDWKFFLQFFSEDRKRLEHIIGE